MSRRLKSLLLACVLGCLLSSIAAAQEVPRLELDWEPAPKDKSYIKVAYDPCCNPKIVCIIGGKKIRGRVINASSRGDW